MVILYQSMSFQCHWWELLLSFMSWSLCGLSSFERYSSYLWTGKSFYKHAPEILWTMVWILFFTINSYPWYGIPWFHSVTFCLFLWLRYYIKSLADLCFVKRPVWGLLSFQGRQMLKWSVCWAWPFLHPESGNGLWLAENVALSNSQVDLSNFSRVDFFAGLKQDATKQM